jgi:DNA-binding PucR family transcriptional regulator
VTTALSWERPSPRVAELIRTGAQLLLDAREDVFAEVDAAILADPEDPIAADPVIAEAVRRNNHSNLVHWASANVRDPGGPVEPDLSPDLLGVARDFVRRGYDQNALHAYRIGQNVGWQRWMGLAFELTADPDELREFLDISARSIFSFVDTTVMRLAEQIDRERDDLTRGTQAQRLEVVTLILEGAPIGIDRASTRLAYALDRSHTAAIVWQEGPEDDAGELELAAEEIGRAAGARSLTVKASASSLWVWLGSAAAPERAAVERAIAGRENLRVALGSPAAGLDGFRRSHFDAVAAQRLMHRAQSDLRIASYEDVQVAALVTRDEERAVEFVRRTLGDFADAPEELHETARAYVREQFNATRTARVLFTHRNTVLKRLARMEEMLPEPLEGNGLQVGLALEILHWLGPPAA